MVGYRGFEKERIKKQQNRRYNKFSRRFCYGQFLWILSCPKVDAQKLELFWNVTSESAIQCLLKLATIKLFFSKNWKFCEIIPNSAELFLTNIDYYAQVIELVFFIKSIFDKIGGSSFQICVVCLFMLINDKQVTLLRLYLDSAGLMVPYILWYIFGNLKQRSPVFVLPLHSRTELSNLLVLVRSSQWKSSNTNFS